MRAWLTVVLYGALLLGSMYQGSRLYLIWQDIPRQDINAWRVEYANLHLMDSLTPQLEIQVRSDNLTRLKFSALPAMYLTLSDAAGQTIAEKKFAPQEWLPEQLFKSTVWLVEGVPSQTEINAIIPLEIPSDASGFQIQLSYH